MYEFNVKDFDFPVSSRCLDVCVGYCVFAFENITPEAGLELAKFYSERLHAAKPINMCQ